MRFKCVFIAKCFVAIFCIIANCTMEKENPAVDANKELLDANPPVSYQPLALGQMSSIIHDEEFDTLCLIHSVEVSSDTSIKFDFLYSNIEIFNNRDSLLFRFCSSSEKANQTNQIIHLKNLPSDSFRISTWGFGYEITEGTDSSSAKNNKLTLRTSLKQDTSFPRSANNL